jgi:membrane protein implicated in regulation of membrane protease activity
MLIYAAIGAFGLIFLLVMLFVGDVFGGDHDIHVGDIGAGHGDIGHDAGPGFLSARIMSSFLTAFGVGGMVARYYGLSHPASAGCGVVSGLAMSGLVYQFAKVLYSQQASSEVRMTRLIGKTAEVTVGIPQGGMGQVTMEYGGERTTQIARSKDGGAIAPGTEVVVTDLRGDSIIVERARAAAPGGSL